jgi:hypothetical protein
LRQAKSDQQGIQSTNSKTGAAAGSGAGITSRQSKPTRQRQGSEVGKASASTGAGELPPLMILCEMDRVQLLQECVSRGIQAARGDSKGELITRLRGGR